MEAKNDVKLHLQSVHTADAIIELQIQLPWLYIVIVRNLITS